ncbi:uncharacterized protein LOC134263455 [Saccostrea cucullata]|uniref:uncharacterized protein LOC134263455 n=1 Tax=Saccostrea cuccullata TaxID=36930 RepID=UPI002ED13FC0
MKTTTIDLLTIQHQSNPVKEFDPDKAIKLWMKTPCGQRRRLNYKRAPVTAPFNTDNAEPIDVVESNEETEEEPQVLDILKVENEVEEEGEIETECGTDRKLSDFSDSDSDSDVDVELTEIEVERELERIQSIK